MSPPTAAPASAPISSPGAVQRYAFDSATMTAEASIALWRDAIAALFEADEFEDEPDRPFRASLDSFALGPVLLGLSRAGGQRFLRTAETVARSGVDHVIVQLYAAGGYRGVAGEAPITVEAGDICILDLAQTLETRATAFEVLTLVVPRPMLARLLPQPEALHGLVLKRDRVLTQLLSRHFIALFELASRLTYDECEAVAHGTVSLVVACLRGEIEARSGSNAVAGPPSILGIKQHIEARLGDPKLSADSIAQAFGMSRASLYRLLAPLGGVAGHIRRRRLHRAFFDLVQPADRTPRIGELARRWSLGDVGSFTRAFKAAYGVTPSAVRAAARVGASAGPDGAAEGSTLTRWMRQTAPP